MKSIKQIGFAPVSLPLSADNIVEFHAARIFLLISLCGTGNRIDGLTKMAKLDFFVRYPDFFAVAKNTSPPVAESNDTVRSAMIRHHYGPWDKRYYHVLAYLEARQLIEVVKKKNRVLDNADTRRAQNGDRACWKAVVCVACRENACRQKGIWIQERQHAQEDDLQLI